MSDFSFVDPETHAPLALADAATLDKLRAALTSGTARHVGSLPEAFDGAYLTADRRRAYLVIDGIPTLVVSERVEIEGGLS